ncbi:MAG: hypothetical protein HY912_15925 [Desulfomonile tiedjei]|uniref:Uncharacterized protein n=1 Tax=Desulfomonile tiedjei TaxID=2358 RepID=A0A9D6Z4X0_9BACT|nr:hypothetical protein [Desulfomonile tiedjei]
MVRSALILLLAISWLPATAEAFSLPLSGSKQKFEAEDCPSNVRQALKAGKRDASRFATRNPLGTWSGFLSTGRAVIRKCSPLMKKTYIEAARNTITKKIKRKRVFTPKRSLTK